MCQAAAAGYSILSPPGGCVMIWNKISLVVIWLDRSVGGNCYSGGVSWVVFMGEFRVPNVFCFSGRIWGPACGSKIVLKQTWHPTCCHRLAIKSHPQHKTPPANSTPQWSPPSTHHHCHHLHHQISPSQIQTGLILFHSIIQPPGGSEET